MRAKSSGLGTLLVVFVAFLTPSIADAGSTGAGGLVIDIPSITIPQGGTGSMDVLVEGTGTADLSKYSLEFQVTQTNSPAHELDFTYSPSNQAAMQSNSNYVFGPNGDTDAAGAVGSVGSPATTYTAADKSNTGAGGVVVSDTHQELLAHLDFTTLTGTPPVAGDTYTVSVVTASSSFDNPGNAPITFMQTDGTITIDGAAGVPEPSSLLLLAAGLGFGWYRTRRNRTLVEV